MEKAPVIVPARYGSDFLNPSLTPAAVEEILLGPGENVAIRT